MSAECSLPLLSIQGDWEMVFNTVGEEMWISAKVLNQPSVHGKIKRTAPKVKGITDPENFATTDEFKIERIIGNSVLIVNYKDLKTLFLAPNQTISNVHKKGVVAVHTCENSENKAISASGSSFKQWDSSGHVLLEFKGHAGDLNKVYYFPSGVVTASCSMDMQIKIVCAETGNNPRTLIGHTRSVTDLAIVARGKNLISVSKDCSALLWNVGEGKIIAELIKTDFPILCCDLISCSFTLPEVKAVNKSEFDTNDKILLVGCEGGNAYILSVQSRQVLYHVKLGADVKSAKFVDDQNFIVGLSNGKVIQFKIKQNSKLNLEVFVSKSWHYTESCVECILPCTQYGFFAGYHDGHCVFQFYNHDNFQIHLTGSLFDPIYALTCDGTCIYSACRDGNIRKYLFENLLIEKAFFDK